MLNLVRDIQSLSNFKRRTAEFVAQMKETGAPMVLTVNGQAELVVQDAAAYQKLLDAVEYLEAVTGIQQGLAEVEAGQTRSLESFQQEMQRKYDISGSDHEAG